MGYLILLRHAMSTWNRDGKFTGITDVPLSQEGVDQARSIAQEIQDYTIDTVFVSNLKRARQTYDLIVAQGKQLPTPIISHEIRERDYGVFTGKHKQQIRKEIGDRDFQSLRRGFDFPVPQGETLRDVYHRTIPYFKKVMLPLLESNKTVLVIAHGNSLRSIIKYLDNLSDTQIEDVELDIGHAVLYEWQGSHHHRITDYRPSTV